MNAPPCEKYPPEFFPCENYPKWNLLPTCKSYKWKKKQIYKFFCLEENPYQKVLFDTQMISQKRQGLDTFFKEWKKSKNRTKAKIAKWHLLASCTSQEELKLGSQIIKFGK